MEPNPTPDEVRAANPTKFDEALKFLGKIERITGDILTEISVELLADDKFKARFNKDTAKSEEEMMKMINRGVKVFLGIIPLALSNGVNPLMTILSSHSLITKDPFIAAVISKLNEETLSDAEGT